MYVFDESMLTRNIMQNSEIVKEKNLTGISGETQDIPLKSQVIHYSEIVSKIKGIK